MHPVIDTTNAIESLHSKLHKIIKTRGHFPSADAATTLMLTGAAQLHS
jgi:transposase-like protein